MYFAYTDAGQRAEHPVDDFRELITAPAPPDPIIALKQEVAACASYLSDYIGSNPWGEMRSIAARLREALSNYEKEAK